MDLISRSDWQGTHSCKETHLNWLLEIGRLLLTR